MHKSKFKIIGLIIALSFSVLLVACSGETASNDSNIAIGGEDIEIPYSDAGSTVRSLVLAEVLEDIGYDVTSTQVGATGPMFASTAENKDTLNTSGWFPSTDKEYLDKYGDDIEVYESENFIDNATVSLAVPTYMEDVDSINDLKDNKDLGKSVDWEIIGIDPRTGIMKNTEKGLEDNDLDKWELKEGTELSMLSELQEKYEKQAPIIITGWQPHWIFNELDLKLLKDPDKIYGNNDDHINLVFNKGFQDEHPAAYKVATKMASDWTEEDEEKLMKQIFVKGESAEKVATDFVDDHTHRIDKWKQDIEEK
ncbi:MAG TPA: glycine betaine ABC transporter substrate-binding protein [Pseudogracilibacillus sp.]|nr:glycine betaine ABC transporter substrate-binding protein [Pseudogracilibacillus sp.]